MSDQPRSEERSVDLAKVSTVTATAIAVADMVGIGVFTSLGFQVGGIPSAFSLIVLWAVGGLTALCGALCYAELAAALPRSGGEYNFLSRIYHPGVGFLAGWISATVGFAAPIAVAAMAFGTYFLGAFPGLLDGIATPAAASVALGLALAWIVTLVHLSGLRHSTVLQNVSTAIKVALIVAFIAAGFAFGTPQPVSFAPSSADIGYILSAPFAISLVYVMYSYSGWNAATYIINEVRDPERSLPRSLLAATLIVLVLYVALNAVFLYTTPMAKMAGQVDVARVVGAEIFGEAGGRLVAGLICIGLISAVSAMVWIGPRVTMVIGEDLPGLRLLARKTASGVPATALLLQLGVVTVMLLTQSFETVIHYIQFSLTFCTFLAVLGVIVLRFTRPELRRPYRVWAYPLTPLIFLAVTGYMMLFQLTQKPMESVAGLLTMLAGLAVFAVSYPRPLALPMGGRDLGRALFAIGAVGTALSYFWWLQFYGNASTELGSLVRCLFISSGSCGLITGVANVAGYLAYNPLAMWLSIVMVVAGLAIAVTFTPRAPERPA